MNIMISSQLLRRLHTSEAYKLSGSKLQTLTTHLVRRLIPSYASTYLVFQHQFTDADTIQQQYKLYHDIS
jgi:hypothetical protein